MNRDKPDSWYELAACAGMPGDTFYADRPTEMQRAKDICATCPVITECRNAADAFGVWGGMTPGERAGGPALKNKERTAFDAKEYYYLRDRGLTNAQIANLFGMHLSTLTTTARRLGLTTGKRNP